MVARLVSARALMVLGTASHVGKSLLTAAFCRILAQDGYAVAPFKAQNMSLNSAATPEGLEIGRAQAMQAEAAGIAPSVDMNPVLLKPSSDRSSQVVLCGRVWGEHSAADYHQRRVLELFPAVLESYGRLAERYDVIILEGAGSPAEINLRDGDIVNMRMAHAANARCVLVADIDRGGVFAALVGTFALLEPADRERIDGFIINKFRGDPALLQSGIADVERRLGKRCLGVVPFLHDVGLDEEDSVSLEDMRARIYPRATLAGERGATRRLRIAVIALPYMSNFTDFDALAGEPSVCLWFARSADEIAAADLVIIPGTKATLADARWLRDRGFADALERAPLIAGICGGMQILGLSIADPHGLEGGGSAPGLGRLAIRTTLDAQKTTVQAQGTLAGDVLFGQAIAARDVAGYEIHLGSTAYEDGVRPFAHIVRVGESVPLADGAISADGRVISTYLHGIFSGDAFRHAFIAATRAARGLAPADAYAPLGAERAARFDRLAAHVRACVDVPGFLACAC